jgi:tetratricopeptide (TPR) repeat protein
VDSVNGVSTFDYTQVVSARTLADLLHAGVNADRLRRSIRQMKSWLGDVQHPLLQLSVLEKNGELLVRLEDGLAEPTGQRHFDFADPIEQPTVTLMEGRAAADEWFEQARKHEDAGRTEEAVKAYREALFVGGPDAFTYFNMANALSVLGKRERAIERYYQCVELDPEFTEAWNNLGVLLSDVGQPEEAASALERALKTDPQYSDAHYNLADLLDETGSRAVARPHWRAYLRHDQQSQWAAHARKRLSGIGG